MFNNRKNRNRKDASYKNFICALLAFLAMLILISLLLYAFKKPNTTKITDEPKSDYNKGKNNKPATPETTSQHSITTIRNSFDTETNLTASSTLQPSTSTVDSNTTSVLNLFASTTRNISTQTTATNTTSTETSLPIPTTSSTRVVTTEKTRPSAVITTESDNLAPTSSTTVVPTEEATPRTIITNESDNLAPTNSTHVVTTEKTRPSAVITTESDNLAPTSSTTVVPTEEATPRTIITNESDNLAPTNSTHVVTTEKTRPSAVITTEPGNLAPTSSTPETVGTHKILFADSSTSSFDIGEYVSTDTTPAPFEEKICEEAICKRVSSTMLSMMNHENINKCGDYFNKICLNPEESSEDRFLGQMFKNLIHLIDRNHSDGIGFFGDFYHACNNHAHSINRINRIKNLKQIPGRDFSDIVIESILTQSMPFFDVGLNIRNDIFILEMTLPGLSYLKTNIKGWSLREQIKESCFVEIAGSVVDNIVRLNQISSYVDKCIQTEIENYIIQFSQEIEDISKIDDMDFLKNIVPKEETKMNFFEILNIIQENLALYRNVPNSYGKSKSITLHDLNKKYDLDIDWVELFEKLLGKHKVTGDTNILFSDYLNEVFTQLSDKKYNVTEMLNLWYNVEYYKNFVIERHIGNRGLYCMKLTSQLMPEISSYLITNITNKNTEKNSASIENTAKKMMDEIKTSFQIANLGGNSIKLIQEKLDNFNIKGPELFIVEDSKFPPKINETYENQLIEMIRTYKRTIYDKAMNNVTSKILLKFFVSPFDTYPRTFPPFKDIVYQPGYVFDITKDLPNYVILAKKGLPLAQEIFKQIIYNDHPNQLNNEEIIIYKYLNKSSNTENLLGSRYTVEKIECEVEGASEINLNYESLVCDNRAFELVSELFQNEPNDEELPFVNNIPVEENFLTLALQDFCKPNDLADFIADYYNKKLPAPIKIKNMITNSNLFIDTFNC
ncbi:uncharacterized protein LOC130441497 [Diorhabda sublineata]|uniref:uncharacterized protein LOC130441497 n=1 Tax=Diorhabda sublineata TaxID=1163346 RepID=UPI0024E0B59C|nr:uncharacterized protein LOC130441497 [Diorhabda sublineata]